MNESQEQNRGVRRRQTSASERTSVRGEQTDCDLRCCAQKTQWRTESRTNNQRGVISSAGQALVQHDCGHRVDRQECGAEGEL